jgi:hypothetical protein
LRFGADRLEPAIRGNAAAGDCVDCEEIRRAARGAYVEQCMKDHAITQAQMAAFREWDQFTGQRFADLKGIRPTLVVNGVRGEMILVRNSYWLGENLPNAVRSLTFLRVTASLFQFHGSFTPQAAAFLEFRSASAPY